MAISPLEMVSSSRIDGGAQVLSAGVRRTIQSIKEVVRNHSDADIYMALKENNMDPNETIHRLINQDPFHEVKRRKERRKENKEHKSLDSAEPRKNETVRVPLPYKTHVDRNTRRGGTGLNVESGASVEFRVARDNRIGQNASRNSKPAQSSTSTSEGVLFDESLKSSGKQKPGAEQHSPQASNRVTESLSQKIKIPPSDDYEKKEMLREKRLPDSNALAQEQTKENKSRSHSLDSSGSSLMGVYSSSFDSVHVPSPNSSPPANIGIIRREVGVVGPRHLSSNNSTKHTSSLPSPFPCAQSAQDSHSKDSSRSLTGVSKSDKSCQNVGPESISSFTAGRSVITNSRSHQIVGHQRAHQPNKEWKPKSSAKPSANSLGVNQTHTNAVSPQADNAEDLKREPSPNQEKMSKSNFSENQNVIIAAHICVSESDRCRLTFGSLGSDIGSSMNSIFTASEDSEELSTESSVSAPVLGPESSENDPSISRQLKITNDSVISSGSRSPALDVESGKQLSDRKESSSPQHLENHADVGLVRDNSPSHNSESLKQQEASALASFSGLYYDPQMDMSHFHPVDDTTRENVLPSPQEVLNTQITNSNPASTISMVQQQQHMAHMYPQMHVSHLANLIPYRQFVSPIYGPPMPVTSYSNGAAYPHPSNGSSYFVMPGTNSQLSQNGVKYGMQQFKPVPIGSATGFGNFTSPAGYTISGPGVAGGTEDSSRLKYKDGLYVPNPQAEISEIWMNPRDFSSLQSASYYNIAGQTPQTTYLTSQVSFNPAASAHSSHRQFPGMYHPPRQPSHIASPHPLGPTMGGNVGAGMAASSAHLVAYQQPQMGQTDWAGKF